MSMRGARTTGRGRFYLDAEGGSYWSVTTILGILPKPALPYWAAKKAAEYAADNQTAITELLKDEEGGRDAVVDLIKRAPWRYSEKRMDIGTHVHQAIEAHVTGRPFPPIEDERTANLVGHFHQFLADWQPTFEASEMTVFNRTQKYAGTLDAIVVIDGQRLLLDVKTGSGVYPEAGMQIAMYRMAEFLELPDGQAKRMPKTDGGAVLHLHDDGYSLVPVQCDDTVFQLALYAREIYRWQNEVSPDVVGEPMTRAPQPEATDANP